MKRIYFYLLLLLGIIALGLLLGVALYGYGRWQRNNLASVKVGILHSMTGTLAISEVPVIDATLLAIEEVNEKGGVLGHLIEPIVVDGKSDPLTFAKQAEQLITHDAVAAIFGCWTSASRKEVKPIVEKYNVLLFYPVQYEGIESSPDIIYVGAAPNQQILPAVEWAFKNIGTRFYLVGSDYVFPRIANEIIKEKIKLLQGTVVGEKYLLLGSRDVASVIEDIKATSPQVILNTINGDTNIYFFEALRQAGITADKISVISFSIAEQELLDLGIDNLVGHYAAWNYFQSLDTPINRDFVRKFKNRYGSNRVVSDPMEAAYCAVHLWANAVNAAGSVATDRVRRTLRNQSYQGPEGKMYIDYETLHTWRPVRIGKIQPDGQFAIVWDSQQPVPPRPYPIYKTKQEWEAFLQSLYTSWGNRWVRPS